MVCLAFHVSMLKVKYWTNFMNFNKTAKILFAAWLWFELSSIYSSVYIYSLDGNRPVEIKYQLK